MSIFTKFKSGGIVSAIKPEKKIVTVEEIHETFFTEVERILEHLNIRTAEGENNQEAFARAGRLATLGFTNAEGVQEAYKVSDMSRKAARLREIVVYFRDKYPQYKYIHRSSIAKICKKYGLVWSGAHDYIGKIPEKNLEHMENFKISREDEAWTQSPYRRGRSSFPVTYADVLQRYTAREKEYHMKPEEVNYEAALNEHADKHQYWADSGGDTTFGRSGLMIAAPRDHFDMKNREVSEDLELKVDDPVVFKPVLCPEHTPAWNTEQEHFLIVTAWGKEASDDLIRNPKMN